MTIQKFPPFGRRLIIAGVALVLLCGTFGIAWAQQQVAKKERIRELQEERLAVAKEFVNLMKVQANQGVGRSEELLNATRLLLEAELDLCLTKEDRIRVHQDMVKVAETIYEQHEQRVRAAITTRSELLRAKLNLLKAQIDLERVNASKD